MADQEISRKLAVIVHADVVGSTALVQRDETLAHQRINAAFQRFSSIIQQYNGTVHEIRGDALVAEFARASDAVCAALSFQRSHTAHNTQFGDDIVPVVRIGIALGEEVFADDTVTGPGVVLAQRVEQLAEPGGVCITSAIHEAIPNRMPFDQESLGEQDVKGFEEPIRVYRVVLKPGAAVPEAETSKPAQSPSQPRRLIVAFAAVALVVVGGVVFWLKPWMPEEEPASVERMALPLPDKPSIAVLPFTNMSDDPKQEYFVDGMTEDLITDLSKLSGLFVIARNSVFTYKGKPVKIRQVAEELGVRYVLEGSVRRADNQVRINAQLIDATTGGHVWAERYDGSLDNVFAMQDQVTRKIVTALVVTLTTEEKAAQARIETKNPKAYDAFLQGWQHYRRGTPEEFAKAVSYLKQAIQLDPNYGRAHSALAAVYWNSYWNGWTRSLGLISLQAREQARLYQEKAMEEPSALTHQVASEIAAFSRRRPDKALTEAERAIALDANDPAGYLAMATALLKAGKVAEAVERVRTAMRLDPHYPASYLTRLGQAQLAMGQFQDAATTLERAAGRNPDDDWTFVYLAAAYGHLGREADAKAAVDKANTLRAKAGWGALTLQTVGHWIWLGDRKRLREGLAKAGVEIGRSDWLALVTTRSAGSKDFIHEVKGVTTIDVETAKALHDRGVPFVDVYVLWPRGHIPGAYYLGHQYDDFNRWGSLEFNEVRLLEIVDKTREVVIYSSGGRAERPAASACAKALTWGFEKVYYFAEGFPGWKAAGYPVEKGE